MWRSSLRVLSLAGGVAAAGCADHGSYHVSWYFTGEDTTVPGFKPACGAHGVDSIRVTGKNTGGDADTFVALCTAGELTQTVQVGSWTFQVHQVDVRGGPIAPPMLDANGQVVVDDARNPIPTPDPTATADVSKDVTVQLDPNPVELAVRPACSDGVDNDGDHRVDLDDPDCMGNSNTTTESPPSPQAE
jgi:hypothetical protein